MKVLVRYNVGANEVRICKCSPEAFDEGDYALGCHENADLEEYVSMAEAIRTWELAGWYVYVG